MTRASRRRGLNITASARGCLNVKGADQVSKTLQAKIVSKKAKIAVIGLGYVGLPLAVNFAKKGFQVFGLDTDKDRVRNIQKKKSYILDIPSRELAGVVASGHLSAATKIGRASFRERG